MRFIVINDNYDIKYKRTIEEIKERFYNCMRKILEEKKDKSHPLYSYTFDSSYEKRRKFELEKYMLRTVENNNEEKKIMEEIRQLDITIRKEERE